MAFFSEKKVESFILTAGRIDIPNNNFFKKDSLNIIKLFYFSMKRDVLIHPNAIRVLRENLSLINKDLRVNKKANEIFQIFCLFMGNGILGKNAFEIF